MKLEDALEGVSRLAFDTAPIIYFVEANPTYDKLVTNIFNRVAGELEGWTSVISLSEVLVQPIVSGRKDLQNRYRELLLNSTTSIRCQSPPTLPKRPPDFVERMAFACPMRFKLLSLLTLAAKQFSAMIAA